MPMTSTVETYNDACIGGVKLADKKWEWAADSLEMLISKWIFKWPFMTIFSIVLLPNKCLSN